MAFFQDRKGCDGPAIVLADGWYEWKKEGDKKQPYYIYRKDRKPLYFAAIGKQAFDAGSETDGALIVTDATDYDYGLVVLKTGKYCPEAHEMRGCSCWAQTELTNFNGVFCPTGVPSNLSPSHVRQGFGRLINFFTPNAAAKSYVRASLLSPDHQSPIDYYLSAAQFD